MPSHQTFFCFILLENRTSLLPPEQNCPCPGHVLWWPFRPPPWLPPSPHHHRSTRPAAVEPRSPGLGEACGHPGVSLLAGKRHVLPCCGPGVWYAQVHSLWCCPSSGREDTSPTQKAHQVSSPGWPDRSVRPFSAAVWICLLQEGRGQHRWLPHQDQAT